jgi:hypothetical protein
MGAAFRCHNIIMPESQVAAGFSEMWQPVYAKYSLCFECADKLAPIVSDMIKTPVEGKLLLIVGRMIAAAANSYGALLTLERSSARVAQGAADCSNEWVANSGRASAGGGMWSRDQIRSQRDLRRRVIKKANTFEPSAVLA